MRSRRVRVALCVLGLAALACVQQQDPVARLCEAILARKLPGARVVSTLPRGAPDRTALAFETDEGRRTPARHRLECEFQAAETGGMRLRSARLDGGELTDAELAVINSELFLADLQRAGAPGTSAAQ